MGHWSTHQAGRNARVFADASRTARRIHVARDPEYGGPEPRLIDMRSIAPTLAKVFVCLATKRRSTRAGDLQNRSLTYAVRLAYFRFSHTSMNLSTRSGGIWAVNRVLV